MGFNCGIVGLPNSGKSTIFNALTAAHVPAEAFPFCTTDHNEGRVAVPDTRLKKLAEIFKPERVVSTTVEFVDIAGLVKDAHKGEGLGNRFLSYIREVDAIAHVVRCFDNDKVSHVYGRIDPITDIEVVNTELLLADMETVDKRLAKLHHGAKLGKKEYFEEISTLEKFKDSLAKGTAIRLLQLTEKERTVAKGLSLLTAKPVLYVANGNETDIKEPSERVRLVEEYASREKADMVTLCGGIEAELIDLSPDERIAFLKDLGLTETFLDRLIHAGYRLLDLITFFTKDGSEVRAWTVKRGAKAPEAAGKIHTDFEKGFIKAEVYSYEDLLKFGDEHEIRRHGHIRQEGHDYIVKDGDIIHFKFNV